jgi:predicted lipoprotein
MHRICCELNKNVGEKVNAGISSIKYNFSSIQLIYKTSGIKKLIQGNQNYFTINLRVATLFFSKTRST